MMVVYVSVGITCWRVSQGVSVVSCFPVYIYSHCLYSMEQLISSKAFDSMCLDVCYTSHLNLSVVSVSLVRHFDYD
jgi:hypothetical protein